MLKIPPGQFAYLFSKERITLREGMLGFISIKSKHKWKGLINISGFHVDPGYKGLLKFAVYNAGSGPIFLKFGDATFQLWIATFDQPATPYNKPGCIGITTDDFAELSKDVPSPASLNQRISVFESMPSAAALDQRITKLEVGVKILISVVATLAAIASIIGVWLQVPSCSKSQSGSAQIPSVVSQTRNISASSSLPSVPAMTASPSSWPLASPQIPAPTPSASITPVQHSSPTATAAPSKSP